MVVVFPAPFTPITIITEGEVERSSPWSSPIISAIISCIRCIISLGSVIPSSLIFFLSLSQISSEVSTPTSLMISVSSSCSNKSSSIFVNELSRSDIFETICCFVFRRPAFILLKSPIKPPDHFEIHIYSKRNK